MNPFVRYYAAIWSPSTWRSVAYLVFGLPLGIASFVYAVSMLTVSVSLVIVWVGVPLLLMTLVSLRGLGAFERRLANKLIDAQVDEPGPRRSRPRGSDTTHRASPWRWGREVLADGHAWRVAAWAVMHLVFGVVGFISAVLALVMPVALVAGLIEAVLVISGAGGWMYDAESIDIARTVSRWVLVGAPGLLALIPAFPWLARAVAAAHRPVTRWALGPCAADVAAAATARAQLAEEQVRIDQELHDSIGHMITMNVIQAGAGAHVFDSDPDFALSALRTIEERGRAAMGELDRIIAAIRGDQPDTRTPLPGLDNIVELCEASRAAGMDIQAQVQASGVPAAVGRAAFGIVREALTNAAKHAPGSHVSVDVGQLDGALSVAVLNGAPQAGARASTSGTGGRGVAGMRDRIELLGGKQSMGATAEGGYEVLAVIPLGATLGQIGSSDSWCQRLREKVAR